MKKKFFIKELPTLFRETSLEQGNEELVGLEDLSGGTVWDAMRARGVVMEAPCGGKGRCGGCRIRVRGALSLPDAREEELLGAEALAQGYRLACRARMHGRVEVQSAVGEGASWAQQFPEELRRTEWRRVELRLPWSALGKAGSLVETLRHALAREGEDLAQISRVALRQAASLWRPGEEGHFLALVRDHVLRGCLALEKTPWGVACDLGTTTVAIYLVDLTTGVLKYSWSARNPQAMFGADVVSRMGAALDKQEDFEALCRSLRRTVDALMERCLGAEGLSFDDVLEMVVVGNPPMCHFFLGYFPGFLSRDPFVCVEPYAEKLPAGCLGLRCSQDMPVCPLPLVGGYVGSDMVGVLLALETLPPGCHRLVVDFGTNGEIALMRGDQLWVASAAAGPAFEGGHILQGMSARPGAVHRLVFREGDLEAQTVGDAPPRGICGSGLMEAVVALRQAGVLDASGRFCESACSEKLKRRLRSRNGERGMVLAAGSGEEVVLWQRDVREVQLAKAALQVGIQSLLHEGGVQASEVEECVFAGAFGAEVNPEAVRKLGIVPQDFHGKFFSLGDAAGFGALRVLLEGASAEARARDLACRAKLIPLTEVRDFESLFLAATAFPDMT